MQTRNRPPPFVRDALDLACRHQREIEKTVDLVVDLEAAGLSFNEAGCLSLLTAGYPLIEAADHLGISYRTAKRAVSSLRAKIRPLLEGGFAFSPQ